MKKIYKIKDTEIEKNAELQESEGVGRFARLTGSAAVSAAFAEPARGRRYTKCARMENR
jgi:hypothetical protein